MSDVSGVNGDNDILDDGTGDDDDDDDVLYFWAECDETGEASDDARAKLKLQHGEFEWRTQSNTGYVQWKDTKNVRVLSRAFGPNETVSVKRKQKDGSTIEVTCPKSVAQYTLRMGGVDPVSYTHLTLPTNREV